MVQPMPSENGKGQYSHLIGHQNQLAGIDKWKHVRGQQSRRCILMLCLLINSARTEASDWDPLAGAQTTLWLVGMCAAYVQSTQKRQNRVESAYSVAQPSFK